MTWPLEQLTALKANRTSPDHTPAEVDLALWALLGRSPQEAYKHMTRVIHANSRCTSPWNGDRDALLVRCLNEAMTVKETAEAIGVTSASIHGRMRRLGLISQSPAAKESERGRLAAKAAKEAGAEKGATRYSGLRGVAADEMEKAYFDLRSAGRDHANASGHLRLSPSAAERFKTYWNMATRSPASEGALPLFAHDDEYVTSVMAQGGFKWLSEKSSASGPRVCLPLLKVAA